VARQVSAAAERQLIVDDDNLLMMGGAERMVIVKSKPNAVRHPPSEPPSGQRIPLERIECPVVPREEIASKLWASMRNKGEQFVEPRRRVRRRRARVQIDVRADVPPETEHGLTGVQQRVPDEAEINCSVLNAVKPGRAIHTPAIFTRLDDSVW
jgi:hypothetical protein